MQRTGIRILGSVSLGRAVSLLMLAWAYSGCYQESPTRPAPRYYEDRLFAQRAAQVIAEASLAGERMPATFDEVLALMERSSAQSRDAAVDFVSRRGKAAAVYTVVEGAYYLYLRVAYAYHGDNAYICVSSGAGLHWVAAADEAELRRKFLPP